MAPDTDDLRAAVAAGILTEAQAAGVIALAQSRAGHRTALPLEDEPFELFRGFAEIFVSTGIILVFAGVMLGASVLGGAALPAVAVVLSVGMARYFTLKRRMVLPSVVLTIAFSIGGAALMALFLGIETDRFPQDRWRFVIFCLIGIAGLAGWFRAFRVPFTMVPLGLLGAALTYLMVDWIRPYNDLRGWEYLFDLRSGSAMALATLIFGLLALLAGLVFDMRDPHRLGRMSATGFWLHILSAPALVNTVALTAYNAEGLTGYALLAVALAAVAVLALVIDRRSFLTAGIAWLGILVGWAISADESAGSFALLLLILGGFLTFMGTYWTGLRAGLMRALPEFPGKRRLPPYAEIP
ncbi:MAG: hypothetical protein ACK4KW_00200 [Gemmobacter sp.]